MRFLSTFLILFHFFYLKSLEDVFGTSFFINLEDLLHLVFPEISIGFEILFLMSAYRKDIDGFLYLIFVINQTRFVCISFLPLSRNN